MVGGKFKGPPKNTHIRFRRRHPDGTVEHEMVPVVQRAPLRAATYSPAERFTIVELMIFNIVDRNFVYLACLTHLVQSTLQTQKCEDLLQLGPDKVKGGAVPRNNIAVGDLALRLVDMKLIKPVNGRKKRHSQLLITPKGSRHIRKQHKRLRKCAQKLVFTDILEKLGLAVSR